MFPIGGTGDRDLPPRVSWQVRILPYVDQQHCLIRSTCLALLPRLCRPRLPTAESYAKFP